MLIALVQIQRRKNRKHVMNKSICFNGCSITVGEGFSVTDRDRYVYDRLVSDTLGLKRTNIAKGGSSNYLIFMRSAQSIMSGHHDIVVTQWSGLNRLWLFPGPGNEFFLNRETQEHRYHNIVISKKDHEKLKNQLLILNHDYQNIIDVVDYCNILENLASQNSVECIFINGLIPWTEDLFFYNEKFNLAELSDYAKQILDFDHRNDDKIINFLKQLKKHFETLNLQKWVNIFQPLNRMKVDKGLLGHHPGIESNKIFANMLEEYIINKNLLEKS